LMQEKEKARLLKQEEDDLKEKEAREKRRAETVRFEEEQKRLLAEQKERFLLRQSERVNQLDAKLELEAKRKENLRKLLLEKEKEQEKQILSERRKIREQKEKEQATQLASLLSHMKEFSEKTFVEALQKDEKHIQETLTDLHDEQEVRIKTEFKEEDGSIKQRNTRRLTRLEELEEQQKAWRKEADEKRAARAQFRAFSSIKALIGEEVQLEQVVKTVQRQTNEKRNPIIETGQRKIRETQLDQEASLNRHSLRRKTDLDELTRRDADLKAEELKRKEIRGARLTEQIRDGTNYSSFDYLNNWQALREKRRNERQVLSAGIE